MGLWNLLKNGYTPPKLYWDISENKWIYTEIRKGAFGEYEAVKSSNKEFDGREVVTIEQINESALIDYEIKLYHDAKKRGATHAFYSIPYAEEGIGLRSWHFLRS